MRTLVWFRGKDLRIADHGPLRAALAGGEVVPAFVVDPFFFSKKRAAELPNRIQFLLDSLAALAKNVEQRGSRLLVVAGKSVEVVPALARRVGADRVVAQRWVEPFARERDRQVGERVKVPFDLFEGETILPPGTLRTGSGTPFSVFTPFSRAFFDRCFAVDALPAPARLPALPADVRVDEVALPTLESLGLARNELVLQGGERAARSRLKAFVEQSLGDYEAARDELGREGTSRLSADLKFGTISPRAVWRAIERSGAPADAVKKFLTELVWREFSHSTLWDRPQLLEHPFRADFDGFPWRDDPASWDAWVTGHTGYPVVDASARQLLGEGYVHNRARMISASFLTKHLMISYRRGEAHYMKYLTDGDWAQNNMGWQWSSGSGCDAQPYFRIFDPVAQGQRHDPDGAYVKRWVPELARLPARWIHSPWQAPPLELRAAGVELRRTYPAPIVEHRFARERFLTAAKRHLSRAPKA
jgi:deoxyribodipyrimidine photo-lyase